MERKPVAKYIVSICMWAMLFSWQIGYSSVLTIKQAESAAVEQSPELKSLHATSEALEQAAIAAGELSDPKLMLNTMNVPVDTFDFSQEAMTQIQVGLQQNFPRGRTLHYRSMQKHDLSLAQRHKQQLTQLRVLQGVRLSWLDVYYWKNALKIINKQKDVFQHLLKVAESMLANNKAQQKDVIRAQLELTELMNRQLIINQNVDKASAQLGRWIGSTLESKMMLGDIPSWPVVPTAELLQRELKQHPILKTDEAFILSGQDGVKLAKQQFKPGVTVGMAYGFRQGRNIGGGSRSDFLTAQVSIDLPVFTHNRQDRTLRASEEELLSHQEDQMSHYRQLNELLRTQISAWEQQSKSALLYQALLIPEAKQYAEATMTAYQNAQTDFPTLARAYVRELDIELAGLKASVNKNRARINLLYLQGQ